MPVRLIIAAAAVTTAIALVPHNRLVVLVHDQPVHVEDDAQAMMKWRALGSPCYDGGSLCCWCIEQAMQLYVSTPPRQRVPIRAAVIIDW